LVENDRTIPIGTKKLLSLFVLVLPLRLLLCRRILAFLLQSTCCDLRLSLILIHPGYSFSLSFLCCLSMVNAAVLINTKTGRVINSYSAGAVDLTSIDLVEDGIIS
jgi:hypothetical protein